MRVLTALLLCAVQVALSQKIVLTNDDGWAVAQIRAQNNALIADGFDVVLSAPADNQSGTGSSSAPAKPLTKPCQFNTCPTGSPAQGFNASNPRLNYVNSYPVDAVRYGIETLAPQFFSSPPDFVVSGPNIGINLGSGITASGTVGAACEAALEGIPSTAFSGTTGSSVVYTTLDTDPNSTASVAARTYASLTKTITRALLTPAARPVLPAGVTLNVNFAATTGSGCNNPANFRFVFTRLVSNPSATDVSTCGTTHLPDESTVVRSGGCYVSISVINASTKKDVDAATQGVVLNRLQQNLSLSCYN